MTQNIFLGWSENRFSDFLTLSLAYALPWFLRMYSFPIGPSSPGPAHGFSLSDSITHGGLSRLFISIHFLQVPSLHPTEEFSSTVTETVEAEPAQGSHSFLSHLKTKKLGLPWLSSG